MKIALHITLALGGMSLAIAAVAAFMFYVDWIGQSSLKATMPPTQNIVASVAAAQDIKSLKIVCLSLAPSRDAFTTIANSQALVMGRIYYGIAWFSLGWGLICAVAFIYLHFLLRRVAKQ